MAIETDRPLHAPSLGETDVSVLTRTERDTLLAFLLYRMDGHMRGRLMRYHPTLYNKIVGKEIMTTQTPRDRGE